VAQVKVQVAYRDEPYRYVRERGVALGRQRGRYPKKGHWGCQKRGKTDQSRNYGSVPDEREFSGRSPSFKG